MTTDITDLAHISPSTISRMMPLNPGPDGSPQTRKQATTQPASNRIVPKPVTQAQTQNPREYQINQLKRRFSPKETVFHNGKTSLVFKLLPSDPDFPFELAHLVCDLHIPASYPEERPTLKVKNTDIPKGFSINIERGWDKLAEEKGGLTLLALTNALDKNLEAFLSEQKVDTVKLMSFKDTRHLSQEASVTGIAAPKTPTGTESPKPAPPPLYVPEESYSKEQIAEAKARRAQETRQLEARMNRLPMYRRSADGIVYTLPIEPKRRNELPSGLSSVVSLHLIVPLLYPLQTLRIQLNEAEAEDAEPVEEAFVEKAVVQKHLTLMSHMNFLAQNLHTLAKKAKEKKDKEEAARVAAQEETKAALQAAAPEPTEGTADDKSHIKVIPRPPEWDVVDWNNEESSDDYSDDTDDGGVIVNSGKEPSSAGAEKGAAAPTDDTERGTMISFPDIELHSIELLQISLLSINVKCERCRTVNEVTSLQPNTAKSTSCKKCGTPFTTTFRPQLVHQNSTRAGFLDLSGCKVADMLPSTFVPTCERCSTPGIGLVSVRAETVTNVCRECHAKFTFKIPSVKFMLISASGVLPPTVGPRRKVEKLGLHAGESLPGKGACEHYKKSYRWFRFSCCSKVHPCDHCHDAAEDHMNEWANRMICGWCSREQNYSPEACGFCGRSVIGRKGRGFWEGGKGTRDQRMMSRKDPRKYKRIGNSTAVKN